MKNPVVTVVAEQQYELLPLADIHPSPNNSRIDLGDLEELAATIREHGILEPLLVAPNGDGYELIAGHRRHQAAVMAGAAEAPCIVRRGLDDTAIAELRLIENLHRKDLAPIEEARAYKALSKLGGYKQRQLAERVGRSQAFVSKRLGLLLLTDAALAALDNGGITIEQATALARMHTDPARIDKLLERVGTPNFDWSLRNELDRFTRDEATRKLLGELERQDARVVQHHEGELLDPAGVPFTVEEHAGEPCHAAAIPHYGGAPRIVWLCTDPDRHEPEGPSKLKYPEPAVGEEQGDPAATPPPVGQPPGDTRAESRHRKELAERAAARAADTERRTTFARMQARVPDPSAGSMVLELAVIAWTSTYDGAPLNTACDFLDIEYSANGRWDTEDAERRLVEHMTSKNSTDRPRARHQAITALVCAAGEEAIQVPDWCDRVQPEQRLMARSYLALLQRAGYQPSELERALLADGEPTSPRPDDAAAWYDDPDEGPRWVDSAEADAIEAQDRDRLHRLEAGPVEQPEGPPPSSAESDDAEDLDDDRPDVTVAPKGKKFAVTCSQCGPVGTNTTEAYAENRRVEHLADIHQLQEVTL